jgi:orotidine-5'-phosphate decarboxylase
VTRQQLISQIRAKQSFLCVGLDSDITKLPAIVRNAADPVFEFNKAIIEATHDLCVAYKPNLAFYESLGPKGWDTLQKTLEVIPQDMFTIADAKRSDIGNTGQQYAKAFFDELGFDSITLSPYMGKDSITPFLQQDGKWAIVLALTSNEGAMDFQTLSLETFDGPERVYERVLKTVSHWGTDANTMFVVGATRPEMLGEVRKLVPNHFFLVPGVGAQGGSLQDVCRYGLTPDVGLLVNASRSIIFASDGADFAEKAREEALKMQQEMAVILSKKL